MNREAIEAECKDWIDYGVEYRWSGKLIAFLRSVQAVLHAPEIITSAQLAEAIIAGTEQTRSPAESITRNRDGIRRVYWEENAGAPLVVVDGLAYPLNAGFDRINALLGAEPSEELRGELESIIQPIAMSYDKGQRAVDDILAILPSSDLSDETLPLMPTSKRTVAIGDSGLREALMRLRDYYHSLGNDQVGAALVVCRLDVVLADPEHAKFYHLQSCEDAGERPKCTCIVREYEGKGHHPDCPCYEEPKCICGASRRGDRWHIQICPCYKPPEPVLGNGVYHNYGWWDKELPGEKPKENADKELRRGENLI
jgi:hypothetical protein